MNVYQMNDCDFIAAHNPAEALQTYAEMLGYKTIEELVRDEAVDNEITECSLNDEMWVDLADRTLGKTTYEEAIAAHVATYGDKPFFIASTEY